MRLASFLALVLLTSGAVVHAAPTTASAPKAKKAQAQGIAGAVKLKLAPQPPTSSTPRASVYTKSSKALDIEFASVDKVSVSPQHPLDGGAFMIVTKGSVVAREAQGFIDRGAHLGKESHFAVVLPRAWVGNHDLLVECTGSFPNEVRGAAVLVFDNGFATRGETRVEPADGRVRFVLMTADVGSGNWLSVELTNSDYQSSSTWRVDGCTVERL